MDYQVDVFLRMKAYNKALEILNTQLDCLEKRGRIDECIELINLNEDLIIEAKVLLLISETLF